MVVQITSPRGAPYVLREVVNSQKEGLFFYNRDFERLEDSETARVSSNMVHEKLFILATEGRGFWIDGPTESETALGLVAFWPTASYERGLFDAEKLAVSCLNIRWCSNLAACPLEDKSFLLRTAVEQLFKRNPEKEQIWAPVCVEGKAEEVIQKAGFVPAPELEKFPRFFDGEPKQYFTKISFWGLSRHQALGLKP